MDTWNISSLEIQPHQPEVLRSDEEARVIALNLPAGEKLQDHQVHERAWVVVVSGEVEFIQDGSSETGGAGLTVHFQAKERHEVRAKRDARILLFLAPWPGAGHPSQREQRAG
jgi:quercetin dioxygenase-like cupin family protein